MISKLGTAGVLATGMEGVVWCKEGGCSRAGRARPGATAVPLSWAGTDQIWARGHSQERTVCTLHQWDPVYISIVAMIMCLSERPQGVVTFQLPMNTLWTWKLRELVLGQTRVSLEIQLLSRASATCTGVSVVSHASCMVLKQPCVSLGEGDL